MTTSFQNPNVQGYYGQFGGAYIPEMLHRNVEELREQYLSIMNDPVFKAEFDELLQDYVGRPTPLFLAERWCLICSCYCRLISCSNV